MNPLVLHLLCILLPQSSTRFVARLSILCSTYVLAKVFLAILVFVEVVAELLAFGCALVVIAQVDAAALAEAVGVVCCWKRGLGTVIFVLWGLEVGIATYLAMRS
jgi:hypothetical protein